mgnify:CR=1 FL=1
MIFVQICIGSSCHLKGSYDIVALMQQEIEKNKLDSEISLSGSFCTGNCNRNGVTVTVDDAVHTGITKENFQEFWNNHILKIIEAERS